MKPLRLLLILTLTTLLATPSLARVNVVTTTQDLAAIARSVGGEQVKVIALTPGTRDPHFAVAKPSMIHKVHRADLLIVIGAELEIGWLPALLKSARNADIQPGRPGYLDMSASIELLGRSSGPVDRSMGDVHASGNPHYWLDPANGKLIARAIAARLAQIDPAHAAAYDQRAEAFVRQLDDKISQWQNALRHLQGKPVIAYHNSLVYLARAFGFRIVDEVEPVPGIAPSANSLQQLIERIRHEDIGLLIMEPYYERRSAQYLQEKTGIKVAVIPQSVGAQDDIKTYFDLFDHIVRVLANSTDPA